MTTDFNLTLGSWRAAVAAGLGSLLLLSAQISLAAGTDDVTRYSATTTNIDPNGIPLRFDVLRWSDDNAARAAVRALESEDVSAALEALPTVGYIWPQGSPVGYSIKYARRADTDSGQRLTFVTNKLLGSYDFGGWTVHGNAATDALSYSVIELDLSDSGDGIGMASLATPVAVDSAAGTLGLDRAADSTELFVNVHELSNHY